RDKFSINSTGAIYQESSTPAPRLRFDFPETMLFVPELVTDETGHATMTVPIADSLTTWHVQTDAIAAGGGTAWTQTELKVTQNFAIDVSLPTDVTAGDQLHMPV